MLIQKKEMMMIQTLLKLVKFKDILTSSCPKGSFCISIFKDGISSIMEAKNTT